MQARGMLHFNNYIKIGLNSSVINALSNLLFAHFKVIVLKKSLSPHENHRNHTIEHMWVLCGAHHLHLSLAGSLPIPSSGPTYYHIKSIWSAHVHID